MKNIILGAPGTGKTTYLLNIVKEYLRSGGDPDLIGFISFTKKSVTEAKSRTQDINFKYFRTIHGLAFYMLGLSSSSMLTKYDEFSDMSGIEVLGKKPSEDNRFTNLTVGDQMLFMESLCRMKQQPAFEVYSDYAFEFSFDEFIFFKKAFDAYKKSRLVYDFTDILEKYLDEGHRPNFDLLIVDEAQDLCRLQWDIVEELCKTSKSVYIAGDDDQAIFKWSGADVSYFIAQSKDISNRCIVLSHSYRLPSRIYDLANEVATKISNRAGKVFSPTANKGEIEFIDSLEDLELDKGKWLVLFRNSYMIYKAVNYLRTLGVYYEVTNEEGRPDSLSAALSYSKLCSGKTITFDELKNVCSYIREVPFRNQLSKMKDHSSIDEEMVRSMLGLTLNELWHVTLDKIPDEDREYYISARSRGEKLNDSPRVRLSTIHSAKGGEEDNVVLHLDISAKSYTSLVETPDDELRVLYTGITRSKNALYLVQPSTKYYYEV